MFRLPFIEVWKGFDIFTNLILDAVPFVLGSLIGKSVGKRSFLLWSLGSFFAALCLTVMYQYRYTVHAFDWTGLFLGAVLSYLFFGLAAGRLYRSLKK